MGLLNVEIASDALRDVSGLVSISVPSPSYLYCKPLCKMLILLIVVYVDAQQMNDGQYTSAEAVVSAVATAAIEFIL